MICKNCGAQVEGNNAFCPSCGQALTQPAYQQPTYQQPTYQQPTYQQPTYQQPAYQQPTYQQPAYTGQTLSWIDFYKQYAAKGTRNALGWEAGICIFTAVVGLLQLVFLLNVFSILDIAVYLTMAILLLTKKKKVFALIPTIYSGVWSLVGLVLTGSVTGIVALIAGIICVKALGKLEAAYKAYQTSGILPTMQI